MNSRTVGDCYAFKTMTGNPDDTDDDDWDLKPVTYTYKKPGTAFMLGFFPGFFIHGLGHYYIGKTAVGTRILLVEAASLYMIYAAGANETVNAESGKDKPKYSDALKAIGMVAFFGSWICDFAGAPAKAKKMNEKYGLTLYPEIGDDKVMVKLAVNWR